MVKREKTSHKNQEKVIDKWNEYIFILFLSKRKINKT